MHRRIGFLPSEDEITAHRGTRETEEGAMNVKDREARDILVKFGYMPDDPRSWSRKPVPDRLIENLAKAPLVVEDEIRNGAVRRTWLTPSEKKVVKLVAEGLMNKEIAVQLNLANSTVIAHLRKIRNVLGAHTKTEIVKLAKEKGQMDDESKLAWDEVLKHSMFAVDRGEALTAVQHAVLKEHIQKAEKRLQDLAMKSAKNLSRLQRAERDRLIEQVTRYGGAV